MSDYGDCDFEDCRYCKSVGLVMGARPAGVCTYHPTKCFIDEENKNE
jgi:hypothetical protein